MTATDLTLAKYSADRLFSRKKLWAFGLPAIVMAYLAYIFFAFDVPGLMQRASTENAQKLFSDSYSYKTHVARDNRSGTVEIAIEGERKGEYPGGESPDWVTLAETETVIDLGEGHVITYGEDNFVSYDIPGYGRVTARPSRARGVDASFPDGDLARLDQRLQEPAGNHHRRRPPDRDSQPNRGVSLLHWVGVVFLHARQPVSRYVLGRTLLPSRLR